MRRCKTGWVGFRGDRNEVVGVKKGGREVRGG